MFPTDAAAGSSPHRRPPRHSSAAHPDQRRCGSGLLKGEEILACEQAGVAVTRPKPQTSGAKSAGRFGKPDFVYLTKACRTCPLKDQCTTANERRIKRWEHEHVVEAAQTRLDQNPQAMRVRRETVEHPFGTLKMRMGATYFLMKTLPKVATEMALHVLAYSPRSNNNRPDERANRGIADAKT
jgi:hypothetical protein